MTFRPAAALAALLTLSGTAAAQIPRQDGNWEITVDVDLEGATGKIPARTTTQCITKEEAAAGKGAIPGHHDAPGSCSVSEHKVEGDKVSWTFKCETPQPMSGSGEIVYTDETAYKGSMTFTRDGKTMTMKYEGKRLGDCTK